MEYKILTIKPGEDLTEVIEIRKEIFGQGEDDLDEIGVNKVLIEDGKKVAVGRMLLDMESDRLIIEQIGVIEGRRRQGLGTKMLDILMDFAGECESSEVWAKPKKNAAIIALLKKHGFFEMDPYWMNVDLVDYK